MNQNNFLNINSEIQNAIAEKKPIVALESTIIAHGMPYPENIKTAIEVESIIRNNGAVPATIAILEGKICIGLDPIQLEQLGNTKDVWKVSIRDMAYVVSNKIPGATTVASTMRVANMAGIKIFVTGGIGGVHRGAETSMDISADLEEMSVTSVAVVSAGVKSILDIGLTLEFLETKGIPVITYGQDIFPSFYSRESNFKSPLRMDNEKEIANMLNTKWKIGLGGSVLIANPIPSNLEIPFDQMEKFILAALAEAKKKNISGKEITPFLLQFISKATDGKSLKANIALVKNNAGLGARIANNL
jgi:pseudouridine-5'-phosphate glycosidase